MNKRFIKKIEFEDGYVKKSNVLESLKEINKDYDCETGDYGSVLSEWYTCDYGEVCDSVINLDTEDVQPIVHAHWIPHKLVNKSFREYECSNCGEYVYDKEYQIKYHKFCLHCGARMDEDGR